MEGDFSSLYHSFINEWELDITYFIGVVGDNEASSIRVDALMQDLTTTMVMSSQEERTGLRMNQEPKTLLGECRS